MDKLLILVRHGEAEAVSGSVNDFDRALTKQGRNDITKLAGALFEGRLKPDKIIASPLKRTQETAAILADKFSISDVIPDDSFISEADTDETLSALYRHFKDADKLLCVGHEPNISSVASSLAEGGRKVIAQMVPGACVVLQFWQEIEKFKGNLVLYSKPF